MITSPVVRYTGSKWHIAEWIIARFPKHVCYVETFCGGASVLFRKRPSHVEVLNDTNREIVNFFEILRNRSDELIRAIELTPYSRSELELSVILSDDPLESARRFYIRSKQAFTAGESGKPLSWRFEINRVHGKLTGAWNNTSNLALAVKRLKSVMFECDTALNVISRWDKPEVLFYNDPPYVPETRTTSTQYSDEMNNEDHIALSEALHSIKGMALISGYDSPLYRELYADWKMESIEARTVNNVRRRECLWISPSAQANALQRRLF